MDRWRGLVATAAAQHGVFATWQAQNCGLSRNDLRKKVARGRLQRDFPGVFGMPGVPQTWRRSVCAACLWAGRKSAASHRAAARLWTLPGFLDDVVEISSVSGRRPHGIETLVHRVDEHLLPEIDLVDGIPTTSVRRTLLDLCGRKDFRAERGLDHALFNGLTTLGQLWLLYDEEWTRGRRGIAILRDHLVQRGHEKAPRDGDCARLFWQIVNTHALPRPEVQHPVRLSSGVVVHIDFAYPDRMLAIETDGYAYHRDRRAFEHDRERDAELQLLGWTPVRYTWAKLRFDPEFVARSVTYHLDLAPSGP